MHIKPATEEAEISTYTVEHTPFDLNGTYEHWTVRDADGGEVRRCMSEDRAAAVAAALEAGQTPPAPVWPEPGSGVRTCHFCGLPMRGSDCRECV